MKILMPKATAVWLIENTALSFIQIGAFVGMHDLEVHALADNEHGNQVQGASPIATGLLSEEEIKSVSADPAARLKVNSSYDAPDAAPKGGRRYTSILRRANKPNAISWLVREYPDMTDAQVGRLVGSTKPTIQAIRDRSHWNLSNIEPGSPVELGLCNLTELQVEIDKTLAKRPKSAESKPAEDLNPLSFDPSNLF